MNALAKKAPLPSTELAVRSEAGVLLNIIAEAAKNPTVDVAKLSALLDMQERVLARQAEAEFNAALARLNTVPLRVKKNGAVELIDKEGRRKGTYKFARWEDMDTVIRPLLQAEGFTLSFDSVSKDGGGITVTGTLLHAAGHHRSASIPLALDTGAGRNNLQAMGSTLSYGKRYVTEMLLNIVREGDDDDGQSGGATLVTQKQVDQLENLIADTGADRARFLRYFGVEALASLRAEHFTPAVNMLNAKRARTAQGVTR